MPPKVKKSARAVRVLSFWTADAEGITTIGKWLAKELKDDRMPYFASFTNWCAKQAQRVVNPQTNWKNEEHRERAEKLLMVLRTHPLDVRAYIGHMQKYLKHDFASGLVTGRIARPDSAGVFEIMQGQDKTLEMVFTHMERENIVVEGGKEHKLSNRARLRAKNRAAGDAAQVEEAARAAVAAKVARENESSLGAWGATKNAVREVEKEMAVDETTKAFGQTEISLRQPWEDELADRTK